VSEWKLFDGPVPYVSTAEFHADRERAPHLEQDWHRPRLELAAQFVLEAAAEIRPGQVSVSDLGCGDGGLLQILREESAVDKLMCWGYDFQPSNAAGWVQRRVYGTQADVFGEHRDMVAIGDIVVMTEVLEHLADPHEALRWLRIEASRLVCSSPWNENDREHCAEHAWAWDTDGYAALIEGAGWDVVRHEKAGLFQVVMAK
jgi:SAM-dependent methyltransferase